VGNIIGIACVDLNWAIGKVDKETGKGKLLYNLKQDMQFFTGMTGNHIVAMGENTLLSLPGSKPLKHRVNLVLCQPGNQYDNCICAHSFEEMLDLIKHLATVQDVFIIGGGMFYKAMLPYYDYVYVTMVNNIDDEATVFFPNLDKDERFILEHLTKDFEEDGLQFKFLCYTRKQIQAELEY